MAYIKYKELTKYYNFSKKIELNELPQKAYTYIESDEQILIAYSTYNDLFLLTTNKIIVFDVSGVIEGIEKIHFFPFKTTSSTAIEFTKGKCSIYLSMDSGYQVQLNFVKLTEKEQEEIKVAHARLVSTISKIR